MDKCQTGPNQKLSFTYPMPTSNFPGVPMISNKFYFQKIIYVCIKQVLTFEVKSRREWVKISQLLTYRNMIVFRLSDVYTPGARLTQTQLE